MSFIINVASLALVFLASLGCLRRFVLFIINVASLALVFLAFLGCPRRLS